MLKKFFFYFAATGWLLAFIVHLMSIEGFNVNADIPFVWVLHLGIFVVWLPAILSLRKNPKLAELRQRKASKPTLSFKSLGIVFEGVPVWLKAVAIAGFVYAFFNFFYFMVLTQGVPDIWEGQYVLHNHGTLIRNITEQEYTAYKAAEVRGFSGHWLAFYGLAAALLYPFNKETSANTKNATAQVV